MFVVFLRKNFLTLARILMGIGILLSSVRAIPATAQQGGTTLEVRVAASSDDAEESGGNNSVALVSTDLELVFDGSNQMVGMRFNGISIPRGAKIKTAYIQFQVDEVSTDAASLIIEGQDADNAATFTVTSGDISSRPRTNASVIWVPASWTSVGEAGLNQRTPNIASIIQEITLRPNWASGSSLAIIISGSGRRTAEAYDGSPSAAPLLHVEYTLGENINPSVSISLPARGATFNPGNTATFTGVADDYEDGDVSASLTWTSSIDGAIGSGSSFSTSALSVGVHTITATATDSGGLNGSATTTITVFAITPVLVGAGDIAYDGSRDEQTAKLLENIPGIVVALGDSVYPNGTEAEFNAYYEPTWGRHKARTLPVPGNHEYHTPGATGYFTYFGAAAGDPNKGYYSYNLGDWHIIALNSECDNIGGCGLDSPQGVWLQADLAANSRMCTLAYWHRPLFSSTISPSSNVQDFWTLLYNARADVILNGHGHNYERFAPQDPNGVAEPLRGIREFVVGTGGVSFFSFGEIAPNSEVRDNTTAGVIKLTLNPTSYTWEFVPIAGGTFTDSGSGNCVTASSPTSTPGPTYTPTNTPAPTYTATPGSSPTPTSTNTPAPTSNNPLYASFTNKGTLSGISFDDEDILKFDGQNWSLLFDGSDVGVGGSDLFGFSVVDSDTLLMSFSTALTLNGVAVTAQDIVRFEATSLGSVTAGTFSMYLDGSDVGFDTTGESIDSLSLLPDGRILISTTGSQSVPGASGKDEDVLAFTPTSLGDITSGTWAMYFDGSDVGLAETSNEDVDALDVTSNGTIYLSTLGDFVVNGVSGFDEDVFICMPGSTGEVTTCNYSSNLYFDGSTWGLVANDVDAFNFLTVGPVPTSTPSSIPTNSPAPTNTNTTTSTFTPTNTATYTATPTATNTPTFTFTPTNTYTPTSTPTPGPAPTPTDTPTPISSPTPLPPGSDLRFAIIGDYGDAGQPELDVANLVKSWNPEFVITTGDNTYSALIDQNVGQYYQEFIYPYVGTYGPGAPSNRFFPSIGNHDWDQANGQVYFDYFTLPGNERYYDFVWGPVHFFVIDSDSREPDGILSTSTQALWLQAQLAASISPWNVVYLHHPPYSSSGSSQDLRWPYQAWGADIVLAGHKHNYERLLRNDFPYIINGLGGAEIHPFSTPITGSLVRYNSDYGAMLVTANETSIVFDFITRTGTLIDTYTLGATSTTPTVTPTLTFTPTNTYTPTNTPTHTPTFSPTATFTVTSTLTATSTSTIGPSPTPTYTLTPSNTPTMTLTPSDTPTFTPSPTASNTPEPTFTFTPSATFTPSPTSAVTDLIFADGFESGDFSAWSSASTGGSDLSVSTPAALVGTQGMQVLINDTTNLYVTDESPTAESHYRARFYFDPNSIVLAESDSHPLLSARDTATVFHVDFRWTLGTYQTRIRHYNDADVLQSTGWVTISDAPHYIEVEWWAATAAGANDGGIILWIDGVQRKNLASLDNDLRRIDSVSLGAVSSVDAGTQGTYYLDAFESRRQTYIGP